MYFYHLESDFSGLKKMYEFLFTEWSTNSNTYIGSEAPRWNGKLQRWHEHVGL